MNGTPVFECAGLSAARDRPPRHDRSTLVLRLPPPTTRQQQRDSAGASGDGRQLLAVADGVGREAAGSRASQLTLDTLRQFALERLCGRPETSVPRLDCLQELVPLCQGRLRREAQLSPDLVPMGTTLTVALIDWPMMELLHVGDSRCYLLRLGRMECLTTDHTVAEKMLASGLLTSEELPRSRWRNVLWNAVSSSDHTAMPDRSQLRLTCGDTVLLCSSALTQQIGDEEIAQILHQSIAADNQCRRLIDAAGRRGANSEFTVVVVRLLPPDSEALASARHKSDDSTVRGLSIDRRVDATGSR